nr:hypothetical protein [Tanacetum cinerariifolium]
MHHDALTRRHIHSRDIIDWEFLASQGLYQAFFESINKDPFSGPQWVNLFQINENVYQELVREFFASFEFDASPCRYDPNHLGGKCDSKWVKKGHDGKGKSLVVGIYANHRGWWNIGNTKVTAIKDLKPATHEVKEEDDEANEAVGGDVGNEGAGGFATHVSQHDLR